VQESQLCYKGRLQGRLMLGIEFIFVPSQDLSATAYAVRLEVASAAVRAVVIQ